MPEDLTEETNWIPLRSDDELFSPPIEEVPPLVDQAPTLLPTLGIPWESFERLVLRMAKDLEGASDVRLYGKRGQAQEGIDVVGFFVETRPAIYQTKRWQVFRATDLESAVTKYTSGRRPFNAERFVIAVAVEVRDTAVVEKLHELRQEHPDIAIDLWDREEISRKLRSEARIVRTFFGVGWAERFCDVSSGPAAAGPDGPISADAVFRGPIAYLGLKQRLVEAEAAFDGDPASAAAGFSAIADSLEGSPFSGHAVRIRERQAEALASADLLAEAAVVRLALGWRLLEAGDSFSAQHQARAIADSEGKDPGEAIPDGVVRAVNALSAAAAHRSDYSISLDRVVSAFDNMAPNDPHHFDAGLVLAEEAVATRRTDVVTSRSELLTALAAGQPETEIGLRNAVRLRMCVADSVGGWDELASNARDHYPPKLIAWILARYARHLFLTLRPEAAVKCWEDAIERSCAEGLYEDAADWLYAVRAAKMQIGLVDTDLNDYHRLALALRSSGTGTVSPEPYSSRERALARLLDKEWPSALEELRRYLWRSATTADWAGELEAHTKLGELFAETGRPHEAAQHFIYAGGTKKLEKLATRLPDAPIRLDTDSLSEAPWERVATYKWVEATADLLVDEDAAAWASAASEDLQHEPRQPQSPFAPNPFLSAFQAFGRLSSLSTDEGATSFLSDWKKLIPREAHHYRFTDEAHVLALIGIASAHEELRGEATTQLLEALLADQRMGETVLSKAGRLLSSEKELVVNLLAEPARSGHNRAALGLVIAEAASDAAAPLALERLQSVLEPRVHQPGTQAWGTGLQDTALLMTVLGERECDAFAQAAIALALDKEEPPLNRREALLALLPIAKKTSEASRGSLFNSTLECAKGLQDGSTHPLPLSSPPDPLSRFRIDLGPTSLRAEGLIAVSALADTPDEYKTVASEAKQMLSGADEHAAYSIARALSLIPPDELAIDLEMIATHSSPWLRALAAVIWCSRRQAAEPELGKRLAKDVSRQVRISLAASLCPCANQASAREILEDDPRRSVREQLKEALS